MYTYTVSVYYVNMLVSVEKQTRESERGYGKEFKLVGTSKTTTHWRLLEKGPIRKVTSVLWKWKPKSYCCCVLRICLFSCSLCLDLSCHCNQDGNKSGGTHPATHTLHSLPTTLAVLKSERLAFCNFRPDCLQRKDIYFFTLRLVNSLKEHRLVVQSFVVVVVAWIFHSFPMRMNLIQSLIRLRVGLSNRPQTNDVSIQWVARVGFTFWSGPVGVHIILVIRCWCTRYWNDAAKMGALPGFGKLLNYWSIVTVPSIHTETFVFSLVPKSSFSLFCLLGFSFGCVCQ